jgi:hypothetical protein
MTTKAYRENYDLIDWNAVDLSRPEKEYVAPARSSLPAPFIASDSLGMEVKHLATGRMSDSKSEHRRLNKQLGLVELGNEKKAHLSQPAPTKLDKRERKNAIRKAIKELKEGRRI